jgi:hypothetical protein
VAANKKKKTRAGKKAPGGKVGKKTANKVAKTDGKLAEVLEELSTIDEEILLADGLEEALIGHVRIFSKTVTLYDEEACIRIFMKQGLTRDEAVEHFEYNVVGAWVGEKTPAFATLRRKPSA